MVFSLTRLYHTLRGSYLQVRAENQLFRGRQQEAENTYRAAMGWYLRAAGLDEKGATDPVVVKLWIERKKIGFFSDEEQHNYTITYLGLAQRGHIPKGAKTPEEALKRYPLNRFRKEMARQKDMAYIRRKSKK